MGSESIICLVSGDQLGSPAHGQLSINADGSFSYQPEKDWHGVDHFTYKLSDGRVDSTLATAELKLHFP